MVSVKVTDVDGLLLQPLTRRDGDVRATFPFPNETARKAENT